MYKSCSLYAIQSKKMLYDFLSITDKNWLKNDFVSQNIHPYIDIIGKPRLIEAPSQELKLIQRKIKNALLNCNFPDHVFSGVKNKSYVGNAKKHSGIKYLYKIDISAFFPNICREKVYNFFKNELNTSPDVAKCLTNFCTTNLLKIATQHIEEINNFIIKKKIKHMNHLCTGSAPSSLLSYLVNQSMFSEIKALCDIENIVMTIYVDDVVFSSFTPIDKYFRERISKIVSKNGFNISKAKVRYYKKNEIKKVTGVIIKSDGSLDVPNRLRYKVIQQFNNGVVDDINKLQGCVISARQIKNIYPNILNFIKTQNIKSKQKLWRFVMLSKAQPVY